MKPFLQFRMWLRRGPRSERLLAAGSALVVVGLLCWLMVPALTRSGSGSGNATSVASGSSAGGGSTTGSAITGGTVSPAITAPGSAPTRSATSASLAAAGAASTAGAASASIVSASGGSSAVTLPSTGSAGGNTLSPSSGSTQAGPACGSNTATDKGVTSSQVTVGILLPDAGPVNSYVGIPSQSAFQTAYNAIIAHFNQAGGVQCRKIVPKYYDDNGLDSSSEQATCLQIVQDGVFAVLNNLNTPAETTCLAQHAIPNIWYTPAHGPNVRQFYPYLLSDAPNYDRLIANYVVGAQQEGFFKGMKKLGILEETCFPDENRDIAADLAGIGIGSSEIDIYNYGCPVAVDTPDQDQEAALQFEKDGVTHVMNTAYTYITNFAQSAQNQGYRPQMAVMEDGALGAIAHESSPPPPSSFDGALGITWDQIGAESTPGVGLSPATAVCAGILAKIGDPAPTAKGSAAGALYGDGCAIVSVFVSAADRSVPLVRTGLAAGMVRAGPLDLSYPVGPMDATSATDPTGGQYWRPDRWSSSCGCWHVISPQWHG